MAEPNYTETIQRIIQILKTELGDAVKEYRFGDLDDEARLKVSPTCYVTTASSPEVSRDFLGPGTEAPAQAIETEYWAVFLATGPTPRKAQETVYTLRDGAVKALRADVRLKGTGEPTCSYSTITSIRRLTKNIGKPLEGITVRIIAYNHVSAA